MTQVFFIIMTIAVIVYYTKSKGFSLITESNIEYGLNMKSAILNIQENENLTGRDIMLGTMVYFTLVSIIYNSLFFYIYNGLYRGINTFIYVLQVIGIITVYCIALHNKIEKGLVNINNTVVVIDKICVFSNYLFLFLSLTMLIIK